MALDGPPGPMQHRKAGEQEAGATAGKKHSEILRQALGEERGNRAASADGPPPEGM